MFNPFDFENINKRDADEVPEGIVDASDYHELLNSVTDYMQITDYEDPTSRMVAMMNVINLFHDDEDTVDQDKLYGVVIGCMYHIQTLLCGMEQEDRQEYFRVMREDVFPAFEKEATTLPYYESDLGEPQDEQ